LESSTTFRRARMPRSLRSSTGVACLMCCRSASATARPRHR
jgi:hypothetical protein